VDGGEEVPCSFVIACGDATEELELSEEVLDQMSCLVEVFVVLTLEFSIGFGRNNGLFAGLLQQFQNPFIGVEALVGDHRFGRELWQQHIGAVQFTGLPLGKMKADRVAECIDGSVDFGAQPSLAASDGLRLAPFLRAPALC
jgi:hypothetical protein